MLSKGQKKETSSFWNSVAFFTLTIQTATTVLTMHYSRLPSTSDPDTPQFAKTAAVALAEFGKMWFGLLVVFYDVYIDRAAHDPLNSVTNQIFGDLTNLLKMAVPGCIYAIQNVLLFTALHHLDSSIYQISYQCKIFAAAIWAILITKKSYSIPQWVSFVLLFMGASLAKLSMSDESDTDTNNSELSSLSEQRSPITGLICVACACATSGFAGVFMQVQLKKSASLYVKNIQLGLFGFLMSFGTSLVNGDMQNIIIPYGFLHGFTRSTYVVVALNIFGGYLVAFVLKRASNIVKSFAGGLSVIFVVIGSKFFFQTQFNYLFYIGAMFAVGGNALYQYENLKPKPVNSNITKV